MAVCADYHIPHSEFLGWARSDRDKAVWWYTRQRETCSCGTRPDEWNEEKGGHRVAYVAKIRQCPGCVETERTREAREVKDNRGMHVDLVRNKEA